MKTMNKKYIPPFSTSLEVSTERAILHSSGPSFEVDKDKDSGTLLSNKQDDYAWSESNWARFEED